MASQWYLTWIFHGTWICPRRTTRSASDVVMRRGLAPDVKMKLTDEAKKHDATPPSERTCAKYGLTQEDWMLILKRQGWECAICGIQGEVLWNIDHEHVAGWHKMSDEDRALHVRGILCFRCNKWHAPSRSSTKLAKNFAKYITAYEKRINAVRNAGS